jgi:hypothetical protein
LLVCLGLDFAASPTRTLHLWRVNALGEELVPAVGEGGGQSRAQRVKQSRQLLQLAAVDQRRCFWHDREELRAVLLAGGRHHLFLCCLDVAPLEAALRESGERAHPLDLRNARKLPQVWASDLLHLVLPMPRCIVPPLRTPICDDEKQGVAKPAHCGSIQETVIDDAVLAIALEACEQGRLLGDGALETDFESLRTCCIFPGGFAPHHGTHGKALKGCSFPFEQKLWNNARPKVFHLVLFTSPAESGADLPLLDIAIPS